MSTPRFPKTFHLEVIRPSRGITANVETSYHGVSTHADVFRQKSIFYHADYLYLTQTTPNTQTFCLTQESTEDTEISPRIGAYLQVFFRATNGHKFTLMPCGGGMVSHRTESRSPNLWGESNTRKTQNHEVWYCLTQTVQTFAEVYWANSVSVWKQNMFLCSSA